MPALRLIIRTHVVVNALVGQLAHQPKLFYGPELHIMRRLHTMRLFQRVLFPKKIADCSAIAVIRRKLARCKLVPFVCVDNYDCLFV